MYFHKKMPTEILKIIYIYIFTLIRTHIHVHKHKKKNCWKQIFHDKISPSLDQIKKKKKNHDYDQRIYALYTFYHHDVMCSLEVFIY